jgi:hypothetical protein
MTPELKEEILKIAEKKNEQRVAFYCGRKNFFMGKWIRHAMPASLIMRFFRPDKVRFERLVNPVPKIDGPHGYLSNLFLHYNFSKGLAEWFEKHNKYSTLEAMEGLKVLEMRGDAGASLFSKDPAIRRRALKELSFRMPLRPLLKFVYLYVLKKGFLDGRPGLTYCLLQSVYEYMIVLKMKEMRLQKKGISF